MGSQAWHCRRLRADRASFATVALRLGRPIAGSFARVVFASSAALQELEPRRCFLHFLFLAALEVLDRHTNANLWRLLDRHVLLAISHTRYRYALAVAFLEGLFNGVAIDVGNRLALRVSKKVAAGRWRGTLWILARRSLLLGSLGSRGESRRGSKTETEGLLGKCRGCSRDDSHDSHRGDDTHREDTVDQKFHVCCHPSKQNGSSPWT